MSGSEKDLSASRVLAQGGQRQAETDAPMTPADVLLKAAELLEKPGAWTQGDYARDDNGLGFSDYSFREREEKGGFAPACFCLIGAVNAARGSVLDAALWGETQKTLRLAIGGSDLAGWNDAPDRTQSEVLSALRKAAELGRGKNG